MTIFAHPDDAEFGVAGTLARWARAGCAVTMVFCTSGNVGTQDSGLSVQTVAALREREQAEAARVLGAKELVFLRHDDCQLQPTLLLRRELVRAIRRHKPEVVVSGDPRVVFFGNTYINHPDHRAAAMAALEAVFPCAEMPLLWPEEGPPHKVHAVYLTWSEDHDTWIDIGDTLDAKIAALKAHASQMGDWDPTAMITEWATRDAREGRRHARRKGEAARRRAAGDRGKASRTKARGKKRSGFPTLTESYKVMILRQEDVPPES
jgi:LmbE family N-acetylglucosaminyl deacetylase